ncbi:uncharacterized protein NFIA_034120 [Aspergillus fischeri NRRL 181]|uniref:Uncharacterized protein n=1 Tax=Neosartorya fischeri (strain ATCC 1020 / DSM 3700 / CBS 544.65 / FGSC A1164 / JCM 1740 / NRRL 181 / WB 181) TaxID=331117 RepID=A1CYM6_NEOFI|nr:uncharacterized protein NFIA_034120 [Aspergillus fischeri NRRL 181]EAW23846.1 hypothetical protein NFIA_034120 [Aspergillus fischeri NRRL 181]
MKKALKSNWARDLLIDIARQGPIPQHVAFIKDGNRRFARSRETGFIIGIKVITLYAFSIANFKRPRDQIEAIMALFREQIAMYSAPGGFAETVGFFDSGVGPLRDVGRKD